MGQLGVKHNPWFVSGLETYLSIIHHHACCLLSNIRINAQKHLFKTFFFFTVMWGVRMAHLLKRVAHVHVHLLT